MDWLTFLTEIIRAIAWPVIILVAIFILRKPVTTLIPKLGTLKYKDLELEFKKDMLELKRSAGEVSVSKLKEKASLISASDRLVLIAATSPRAAILEASREMEKVVVETYHKHSVPYKGLLPFFGSTQDEHNYIVQKLKESGKIDDYILGLFQNMWTFRNKVAHSTDYEPDYDTARDYLDSAEVVKEGFRRITQGEE